MTTIITDTENMTDIGMVTDLFVFKDKDDNKFVIQGMGTVEDDTSNDNTIVELAAAILSQITDFVRTDEIKHIGKFEPGVTMLPHYPYGTIHSILGNFEVLLIGGPKFEENEVTRKSNLN